MEETDGMGYLTPAELKDGLLRILLAFDEFAQTNAIRYSLGAGTLLGAVRHQGFIPWDDDIDIYVPRPDYDRIVSKARDGFPTGSIKFTGFEIDGSLEPFIKMIDTSVRVEDPSTKASIDCFLWMDIFPLDGLPNDPSCAKRLTRRSKCLIKLICLGAYKLDISRGAAMMRIARTLCTLIVRVLKLDVKARLKLLRMARSIPYDEADRVANIAWNVYGVKEAIKREAFEDTITVMFEGRAFPATASYDTWLKGMYGNYLELPPEGERKTHGLKAWRA